MEYKTIISNSLVQDESMVQIVSVKPVRQKRTNGYITVIGGVFLLLFFIIEIQGTLTDEQENLYLEDWTRSQLTKINNTQKWGRIPMILIEDLAYFDPDNIPALELFTNFFINSKGSTILDSVIDFLSQTLSLLESYDLITKNEDDYGVIKIHPRVQEIIRLIINDTEEHVLGRTINVLTLAIEEEVMYTAYEAKCIVHGKKLLQYAMRYENILQSAPSFGINICDILNVYGEFNDAFEIGTELASKYEVIFGKYNYYTITVNECIIKAMWNKNMNEEALELANQVYITSVKTLGEENFRTLSIIEMKALIYIGIGNTSFAIKLYDKLLLIYTKKEGIEGKNYLWFLYRKARCLADLGNHEDALEMLEKVYKGFIKLFGIKHHLTQEVKHEIGYILFAMEDYDEALDIFRDVLDISIPIFGKDDPFTLMASYNIAASLQKLNQDEEALVIFKEVYKERRKVFGDSHPETLRTLQRVNELL